MDAFIVDWARIAGFIAGLPAEVGGITMNRFCGSSMSAIHTAAGALATGAGEAFVRRHGLKPVAQLKSIATAGCPPEIMGIGELGMDEARINLDGGALALGHPLGATGARITAKAASLLHRTGARYALATQCIGGGQGIATVLERV